jgi:hypothetical protein
MTVIPFDERPSSQSSHAVWPKTPGSPPPDDVRKHHAVTELLEHGVLSHAFGQHREYKVRTTLTTRPTWQYQCCVLRHGKPMKGSFLPLTVELQSPKSRVRRRPPGSEDMRLNFAREAVDVHFTRCAALQEYVVLSALYDQPPLQLRRRYALLLPLVGVAVVLAYGIWGPAFRTDRRQPPRSQPAVVADRLPTREPRDVPLPASSRTSSQNSSDEQSSTPGPSAPAETPKAISVNDLLAPQGPAEKADRTSPMLGVTHSNIQAGDILHLTGWVHRISRAPDSTYHLYVSPSRNAGSQALVAALPPPNQAHGSPGELARLQAARTFIKQKLLRQQEPSPQGSIMQRPVFVQLTGQLSVPIASPAAPSRGKPAQPIPARWEIRPLLEVQFATPSEPARSQ